MAISQPRERVIALEAVVANTPLAADFEPQPAATGVAVFVSCDQAGSLVISRVGTDGTPVQLGAPVAVTGGTLSVTTFAYNTGPLRLVFTPSAGPADGYVEAQYFGHAGGLT